MGILFAFYLMGINDAAFSGIIQLVILTSYDFIFHSFLLVFKKVKKNNKKFEYL